MKLSKIMLGAFLLGALSGSAWGQDTLYAEYFTGGVPALAWFDPWTPDSTTLLTRAVTGNPSGDGWVGVVNNRSSGGGVGTELVGTMSLADYEIQAQVYCTVSGTAGGPYNGIVARCDTTGGQSYYSLRTDFDTNQRIQLRWYPGISGYGDSIAAWTGAQIPGGVPTQSGWHRLGLKVESNQMWAYYDDSLLAGSPFTENNLSSGAFGVYLFKMPDAAEMLFDDVIVTGQAGPQSFDFIAQQNHFLDQNQQEMTIRPAAGQTIYFALDWDAINGSGTSPAFQNTLKIDNSVIYTENNPGVEPNSNHTTQSNAWTATLGQHVLRWTLDSLNQVIEGNENNNVLVDTFLVLDPNAYDFQADSTWIAKPDTTPYTDSVRVGDKVLFVLHWSVPMGTGASGPFNISMHLDGNSYYLSTFPGVSASGGHYMTVAAPWVAELGFHYFEWMLDADNWINEFNENNNGTLDGLTVAEPVGVRWEPYSAPQPQTLRLTGVFPNPFNPEVTLRFENDRPGAMKLTVYDVAGRQVAVLADGMYPRGSWDVTWSAQHLAAGTYYAVLEGDGHRSVKPLMLVK